MSKILVVDDSLTVRNEVSSFLKTSGLDVITAVDGMDGFQKAASDPSIKLVLSDVNMPNLDGLSMVEKIRAGQKNRDVMVIMLTTENSPAMKDRGKAVGIKGWIVKPFNGPAVIGGIKKLMGV